MWLITSKFILCHARCLWYTHELLLAFLNQCESTLHSIIPLPSQKKTEISKASAKSQRNRHDNTGNKSGEIAIHS